MACNLESVPHDLLLVSVKPPPGLTDAPPAGPEGVASFWAPR
jgi:hypothetical protein